MDQAMLDRFKQVLLERQSRLRAEIARRVDALPEEVNPPGDDWREPTEALDHELTVEGVQEDLYQRITSALYRIDAGTFGCCVGCGRAINLERLEALPYAEYCVDCERRHETA
jgi:DnaK suppressor protein